MKFVIISGSHRGDSQSLKISNWLADTLITKSDDYETNIIDLAKSDIPFWDESAWNPNSDLSQKMQPFLEAMFEADAYILVAPEWGGMVPAMLKNFLLYVASEHAAHKPALIVGVSSGRGGKYPISELRISGFKNNRMLCIPDHLIVQDCVNVMNDLDINAGEEADKYIKKRADYSLDILISYTKALKTMRSESQLLHPDYPFGM